MADKKRGRGPKTVEGKAHSSQSWAVLRTLRDDACEPPQFIVVVEDTEHRRRQDPKHFDRRIVSRSVFKAR